MSGSCNFGCAIFIINYWAGFYLCINGIPFLLIIFTASELYSTEDPTSSHLPFKLANLFLFYFCVQPLLAIPLQVLYLLSYPFLLVMPSFLSIPIKVVFDVLLSNFLSSGLAFCSSLHLERESPNRIFSEGLSDFVTDTCNFLTKKSGVDPKKDDLKGHGLKV